MARIISVCTGNGLPLGETASISVGFQNRHVAQDFDISLRYLLVLKSVSLILMPSVVPSRVSAIRFKDCA